MQTKLADFIRDTPQGKEADAILRKCVHCGFCTATCPTYQVLGDDLDSPRGRIYLIKRALEGAAVTGKTRLHLDRCLTCRACETTCPSGVRYGRLVDIGREVVEARTQRTPWDRLQRAFLSFGVPRRRLCAAALRLGQLVGKAPATRPGGAWPAPRHARRMLALRGCVQPSLAPSINAAAARVLDRIGISLLEVPGAGCCGAVRFHLNYQEAGRDDMRAIIDAWWPVASGPEAEAIVMTASGCGVMVKEYGHLLAQDARYADKAAKVSALTRDATEVLREHADALAARVGNAAGQRTKVAFHSPCTLQHGQQIHGVAEAMLAAAGYALTQVPDGHLCCGSAGTYSILQPELSKQLLANKVDNLHSGSPDVIATANIGCLTHIQSGTPLPVRHWVELVEERLAAA
jgi:glycolate oxidase iron-sulfur subunit